MIFATYAQAVGRAWASSGTEEVKRINTAAGFQPVLPYTESLAATLGSLQEEIATLKKELEALRWP